MIYTIEQIRQIASPIAAAYGVDASKARSKAEAIALIDAAIGVGEGEDVPQLGAALPE